MRTRAVLALTAVGWLGLRSPGGAMEPKLCRQTSAAARRACRGEVRGDLWIAIGVCTNLPDAGERKACARTAKQQSHEEAGECADQFEARQELCDALGQGAYAPVIDPSHFLAPEAAAANPNRFFPLVPGTIWSYVGGGETVTVTVTDETKEILGVTCFVVRDVVEEGGEVTEDTNDYFAQDVDGNVWYFGELSKSLENGELVGLEGSWLAGVDGARPGTIMKAAPAVGDVYRQEFALGTAEDAGEVLSVTASATVPATACSNECVLTRDFTPLEPDANEQKYYAPGVGPILEVDVETGTRLELVSFTAG